MKTIKKSLLKQGYYYEERPWYDALPETLTVPSYREEIFPKDMTHKKILETYKITPYTIEEAFAVAADKSKTLQNKEYRLVYFTDGDTRYGLGVYRNSDGGLEVCVDEVYLDDEWDAGDGVLFSNEPSDTEKPDTETIEPSDTLFPLEVGNAINLLKEHGFKITRLEEKEY